MAFDKHIEYKNRVFVYIYMDMFSILFSDHN